MSEEFWPDFAEAISEMEAPRKTKKVKTNNYEYSYAPLEELLRVIEPCLTKRGMAVHFKTSHEVSETGMRCFLETWVASKQGDFQLDSEPYQYLDDEKKFGAKETYAKRYSLQKVFSLAGEDDVDGVPEGEVTDLTKLLELYETAQQAFGDDTPHKTLVERLGDKSMRDYTKEEVTAAEGILSGLIKDKTKETLKQVDERREQ